MISSIKPVGQYLLNVEFENGLSKVIDLGPFLAKSVHPDIIKYRDMNLFSLVHLDETGAPCWGDNDFDINPQSIINGEFDVKE
jgi:hypothetical protein